MRGSRPTRIFLMVIILAVVAALEIGYVAYYWHGNAVPLSDDYGILSQIREILGLVR